MMNRDDYRAAIDAVPFRDDFQQRTVERLRQAQLEKEITPMKTTRTAKSILLAAAIAAVLLVSVAAAVHFLSPSEAAAFADDATLSAAFSGDDVLILDETVESGGYVYRLAGLVSGKGLSDFCQVVDRERTYAVVSKANADGTPIEEAAFDTVFTPLVAGYTPWSVNTWTLGASATAFVQDGIVYYIYDYDSIEMFADHTVYFAIYEGNNPPSAEIFTQAEDGSIAFSDTFTGAHALFTLPLDAASADPAAVREFLEESGFDSESIQG